MSLSCCFVTVIDSHSHSAAKQNHPELVQGRSKEASTVSDGGEAGVSSDLRAASVTEVSAYLPERVGAGKSPWLN